MKDKTLNLKASQAIASLGIECESEKWWSHSFGGGTFLHNKVGYSNMFINDYSALSFQELLALLSAIGEKLKWKKNYFYANINAFGQGEEYWFGSDDRNTKPQYEAIAHNLLETYLTNYDIRDVSAEIIKLINNK